MTKTTRDATEPTIIIEQSRRLLDGFLKVDSFHYRYREPGDGGKAKLSKDAHQHLNVHRGDSVAGLLVLKDKEKRAELEQAEKACPRFLEDDDRVLLVCQFRFSTLLDPETGAPDLMSPEDDDAEELGFLIELMAGAVKPGEGDLEVLRRETMEETGQTLENIELISIFYPSPGACSERIHLYYGEVEFEGAAADNTTPRAGVKSGDLRDLHKGMADADKKRADDAIKKKARALPCGCEFRECIHGHGARVGQKPLRRPSPDRRALHRPRSRDHRRRDVPRPLILTPFLVRPSCGVSGRVELGRGLLRRQAAKARMRAALVVVDSPRVDAFAGVRHR